MPENPTERQESADVAERSMPAQTQSVCSLEVTWCNANGKGNRSRMRREPHVRFCENLKLKHFNLLVDF